MFLRRIGLTWLIVAIPIVIGCSRGGNGPLPEGGAVHAEPHPDAGGTDRTAGPDLGGASLCPTVVAHLVSVEDVPAKAWQVHKDSHAKAIVSLGKAAGPCLVEKIPDTTPSLYFYLYRHTVGDLALHFLREIYHPASWPFPDQPSIDVVKEYGSYPEFIASPGMRARLRERWSKYVAEHREPTE